MALSDESFAEYLEFLSAEQIKAGYIPSKPENCPACEAEVLRHRKLGDFVKVFYGKIGIDIDIKNVTTVKKAFRVAQNVMEHVIK